MSSIDFFYEEVEEIDFIGDSLIRQMKYLIHNEEKQLGDLSVVFCNDEYLLKINEEYLKHSYYTDIVTFDYCENSLISGDLFISLERIADNAGKYSTTFKSELCRVIFHGLLHLVGYNDESATEKARMREKEDYYLKGMDFDKERV